MSIPRTRAASSSPGSRLDREVAGDLAVTRRGLSVAQAPVELDFGYTFVMPDPDQHRLRVFTPAGR
ncbi:MAG TPA: hypothetical protein VFP37_10870 [Steroidobacteraceae bacterium]|nr:hypothetical protein [Steroidobacteraceae bacterium]